MASVALCAAAYTAFTLHGGREHVPARTWMGGSLFCLALALTAVAPGVNDAIHHLIGVPHVSRLIAHTLTIWAAVAVLCMLAYWTRGPETTRRAVQGWQFLACTATVVLTALFLIARTPAAEGDWFAAYHRRPPIAIYMAVFGGILTYALIDLARLSLRYATRVTTQPVTRVGLRMFAVGGLISLGYSVTVVAVAVAGQLGIDAGTAWTYVTIDQSTDRHRAHRQRLRRTRHRRSGLGRPASRPRRTPVRTDGAALAGDRPVPTSAIPLRPGAPPDAPVGARDGLDDQLAGGRPQPVPPGPGDPRRLPPAHPVVRLRGTGPGDPARVAGPAWTDPT